MRQFENSPYNHKLRVLMTSYKKVQARYAKVKPRQLDMNSTHQMDLRSARGENLIGAGLAMIDKSNTTGLNTNHKSLRTIQSKSKKGQKLQP